MVMPNFLIIGASKGGTTTLNYVLDQHPEIFMCPVKETGFFWAYGEQLTYHEPGSQKLRYRVVDNPEQYQKLFRKASGYKAIGEASVRYLCHPKSPSLIHQFIPKVKLIAILRQPADRAFSSYLHNLRDGMEPCKNFAEAIVQEKQGLRDHWIALRYLEHGMYFSAIQRYLQFFNHSQLFIRLFEDLQQNPHSLFEDLFRFLEVDDTFIPDLSHKHNVSGIIRNPWLRWLWTNTVKLRVYLRPIISGRLRHNLSEWVYKDVQKQTLSTQLKMELTEYYREDILKLQDLLGRDLSSWLGINDTVTNQSNNQEINSTTR